MQVYSNQKHIIYCIIQMRKITYLCNINLYRMCSSATVAATNSATNKRMILEPLINSYLDFL